jgi:hypothetical protein
MTLPMTEAQLQSAVIELARALGWKVAHFRPALTGKGWRTAVSGDGVGFPDLTLLRRARQIVVELKSEKGNLTPEQAVWLAAFERAGVEWHVWRPGDWLDGTVEAVLR